jgi:hypothetical protein
MRRRSRKRGHASTAELWKAALRGHGRRLRRPRGVEHLLAAVSPAGRSTRLQIPQPHKWRKIKTRIANRYDTTAQNEAGQGARGRLERAHLADGDRRRGRRRGRTRRRAGVIWGWGGNAGLVRVSALGF